METLLNIISLILLLALITVPVLLFIGVKKWNPLKFDFLIYLILGLIITAGITWTYAWWADFSNQLLMSHLGYNFEAMNEAERYSKVANENMERVKQLEIGHFGIGWPLKAIITFELYSPYLLIIYFIGQLIRRRKMN